MRRSGVVARISCMLLLLTLIAWPISYWHGAYLRIGHVTNGSLQLFNGCIDAGVYQSWWQYRTYVEPSWLEFDHGDVSSRIYACGPFEIGIGWRDNWFVGLTSGWQSYKGHAGWAGLRIRMSLLYPGLLLWYLARPAMNKAAWRRKPLSAFPVIVSTPTPEWSDGPVQKIQIFSPRMLACAKRISYLGPYLAASALVLPHGLFIFQWAWYGHRPEIFFLLICLFAIGATFCACLDTAFVLRSERPRYGIGRALWPIVLAAIAVFYWQHVLRVYWSDIAPFFQSS